METHTNKKDWPIRAGVIIPKGTSVQLAPVFVKQMTEAGMLEAKESSNSKTKNNGGK